MAATLHRHDSSMATILPIDIIAIEILPRLPTKSLFRFKCVCKFFKTLISSSDFSHLHLRHSLSSDSDRLLILVGENRRGLFSLNLDSPESAAVKLALPRGLESLNPSISVIGSCNGLVCIQISFSDDFRVSLLNPTTGIYRQVLFSNNGSYSPGNFGFGFDSEADDYKIVAMINHSDRNFPNYWTREFMIYSLKTDKWRSVEKTINPPNVVIKSESGTLINNHLLHWKFWSLSEHNPRIRCFDLRTEQWRNDVPLPTPIHLKQWENEQSEVISLGVLGGFLCLSTKIQGFGFSSFSVDMWIMKEYGFRESWMKLLRISYPTIPRFPIAFLPIAHRSQGSRGDEVWIWQDYDEDDEDNDITSKLISYNVEDETVKMAEIQGLPPFSKVYICSESLVAFPGGKTILELELMESILDQEVSSTLREPTEMDF